MVSPIPGPLAPSPRRLLPLLLALVAFSLSAVATSALAGADGSDDAPVETTSVPVPGDPSTSPSSTDPVPDPTAPETSTTPPTVGDRPGEGVNHVTLHVSPADCSAPMPVTAPLTGRSFSYRVSWLGEAPRAVVVRTQVGGAPAEWILQAEAGAQSLTVVLRLEEAAPLLPEILVPGLTEGGGGPPGTAVPDPEDGINSRLVADPNIVLELCAVDP